MSAFEDAFAQTQAAVASGQGLSEWRIDWLGFWKKDRIDPDWLVEPLIARHRSHSINARASGGKSLLLQETSFGLATGRPVLLRPASEPVNVVYLDLEMTEDDLEERLADFGYGPHDDLSHLHYILMPTLPPLDTDAGGAELVAYAQAVNAEFVVIDTTARVLEGPENDADTLRGFHRHTGQVLKAAGITWVRADHLGKDPTRGARGTSAKNDDVDIAWQLAPGEGGISLRAVKRRVRWVPETVAFALMTEPHTCHRPAPRTWALGTNEAAEKLDKAGVPLAATRRAARRMLNDAGFTMGNDALQSALVWRRERQEDGPG